MGTQVGEGKRADAGVKEEVRGSGKTRGENETNVIMYICVMLIVHILVTTFQVYTGW